MRELLFNPACHDLEIVHVYFNGVLLFICNMYVLKIWQERITAIFVTSDMEGETVGS